MAAAKQPALVRLESYGTHGEAAAGDADGAASDEPVPCAAPGGSPGHAAQPSADALTEEEERWLASIAAERYSAGDVESLLVQTHGDAQAGQRKTWRRSALYRRHAPARRGPRDEGGLDSPQTFTGGPKRGAREGGTGNRYAFVRRSAAAMLNGLVYQDVARAHRASPTAAGGPPAGDALARVARALQLHRLRLPSFALVPGCLVLGLWDLLQWALATLVLVYAPLRIAYVHKVPSHRLGLDVAVCALFFSDVLVHLRTAFFEYQSGTRQPVLVACPKRIRINYWRTWALCDAVAFCGSLLIAAGATPVWLFYGLMSAKLTRLWRVDSLGKVYVRTCRQHLSKRTKERLDTAVRLLHVVFGLAGMAHCISCAWYLIGTVDETYWSGFDLDDDGALYGDGVDVYRYGWVAREQLQGAPWWRSYMLALYWSVMTLSTVGYGDVTAETWMEQMAAVGVMVLGGMSFAFLVSSLVDIVTSASVSQRNYEDFMSAVRDYMSDRHVPSDVAYRVIRYFEQVYPRHRKYDQDAIIKELPQTLTRALQIGIFMDLLRGVPVFAAGGKEALEGLCEVLRPFNVAPGDIVCRASEPADAMFVVIKGELDIFERGETEPLLTSPLLSGDVFGLHVVVGLAHTRTHTVVANTQCELCLLPRADVDRLCVRFPQLRAVLRSYALSRLPKAKRQESSKWEQNVHVVGDAGASRRSAESKEGVSIASSVENSKHDRVHGIASSMTMHRRTHPHGADVANAAGAGSDALDEGDSALVTPVGGSTGSEQEPMGEDSDAIMKAVEAQAGTSHMELEAMPEDERLDAHEVAELRERLDLDQESFSQSVAAEQGLDRAQVLAGHAIGMSAHSDTPLSVVEQLRQGSITVRGVSSPANPAIAARAQAPAVGGGDAATVLDALRVLEAKVDKLAAEDTESSEDASE